jgi:hypothetical protein
MIGAWHRLKLLSNKSNIKLLNPVNIILKNNMVQCIMTLFRLRYLVQRKTNLCTCKFKYDCRYATNIIIIYIYISKFSESESESESQSLIFIVNHSVAAR